MRFYGVRTFVILGLLAAFAPSAVIVEAQSGVGAAALSGIVTDETKGALPGVTVTLTQTETGVVRTAVTNEIGLYRVLSLQPGSYLITFELL
jgi:hypothetical protein